MMKTLNKAREVHERSIVVDGISATYLKDFDETFIQNLKKGGITAIHITVPDVENLSLTHVVDELSGWFSQLRKLESENVRLVTTVDEIRGAKKDGGVAVILGSQGSGFLGLDLDRLDFFYRLGMRIMQPTYQERNQFGNGCGETSDSGLSNLGESWVEEMNRLGLVISLSHAGYKTSMDTLEISKDPIVFDHSNPKAVCDVPRNITDEQIQACAEKEGVIGLCPLTLFINTEKSPKEQGIGDFIDHIDYVSDLVGVDHVGIGTDYSEGHFFTPEMIVERRRKYPKIHSKANIAFEDELLRAGRDRIYIHEVYVPWLNSVSEYPILTEALLSRGYSEIEVEKILGENFLKVFEKVWGS